MGDTRIYRKVKYLGTFEDEVSLFDNVYVTEPQSISLADWFLMTKGEAGLKDRNLLEVVKSYRQTGDKNLKLSLPAISPGALMRTRSKEVDLHERIERLTGWMQFDIDLKDNPGLTDAASLRDMLKRNVFVAFSSLSVSGKGVWGLIKVSDTSRYRQHFEQLMIDFARREIILDKSKGGNPTDLRLFSYDPEAYIAEDFRIYDRLCTPPIQSRAAWMDKGDDKTWDRVEKLTRHITERGINIAPDYHTYRDIGFALASEFGEQGRGIFHSICSTSPKYNQKAADKQYTVCLRGNGSGITIGTFFYLCDQAGINIHDAK